MIDWSQLGEHRGLLIGAALFLVFAAVVGHHLRRRAQAMATDWLLAQGLRPLAVRPTMWKRANPKYILKISSSQVLVLARGLDDRGATHEYVLLLGGYFLGPLTDRVEVLEQRVLPRST